MSHPNGDQVEPAYPAAATTSSTPASFQESAAQFAATAAPITTAPITTAPVAAAPITPTPAAETAPVAAPVAAPVDPTAAVMPASAVPAGQYTQGYPQGYAPGYASAASAYPVTGVPVSSYPMVLEPKKKRTGTIVLTVATIVLGLATAGMGTMYLLENGKRTQADTKVSEQAAALEKADQKIKEIEAKLTTSKEENAKLSQDLTGAKNKTDEVTKARDAMAACFQAIDAYARSRNATTAKEADTKCGEASKYY